MTRFVVYHIYRKPGPSERLADYKPGQMQLVFKCRHASEHDAKTSHHHHHHSSHHLRDRLDLDLAGVGHGLKWNEVESFFGHKGAGRSLHAKKWEIPRLLWLTVRRNLAHAFCILNASTPTGRRLLINSSAGRYKFVWLIATGMGNGNGNSTRMGMGMEINEMGGRWGGGWVPGRKFRGTPYRPQLNVPASPAI